MASFGGGMGIISSVIYTLENANPKYSPMQLFLLSIANFWYGVYCGLYTGYVVGLPHGISKHANNVEYRGYYIATLLGGVSASAGSFYLIFKDKPLLSIKSYDLALLLVAPYLGSILGYYAFRGDVPDRDSQRKISQLSNFTLFKPSVITVKTLENERIISGVTLMEIRF